jgi:protein-S-isoprenylcysteine O-methyltransferase Ste14
MESNAHVVVLVVFCRAWVVSLPVTFLMAGQVDKGIGALDWVGWSCWLIGFAFESLADQSKQWHYDDPVVRKTFLHSNVWSVTRHPNYFGEESRTPGKHEVSILYPQAADSFSRFSLRPGEIMCWIGIFLTSASVYDRNTNAAYVSILSPLFTAFLLLFVSGIPLGEEKSDRKYGHLPEYIEYKRTTSPLIPMPNALYGGLPSCAKLLCCCEFPLYNQIPLQPGVQHDQQTDEEKRKQEDRKREKSIEKDSGSETESPLAPNSYQQSA